MKLAVAILLSLLPILLLGGLAWREWRIVLKLRKKNTAALAEVEREIDEELRRW